MAVQGIALNEQEQLRLDELWAIAQDGDHYEMLDVDDDVDRAEIQKAYHALSRLWHPDRYFRQDLGPYGERLEAVFIAINDAYRTLSNESSRRTYDVERESALKRRGRARTRAVGPGEELPESTHAAAEADADRSRRGRRRSSVEQGRTAGRGRRIRSGGRASSRDRRAPRAAGKGTRTVAVSKAMAQMRKQMRAKLRRARDLYEEGMGFLESGAVLKASSALSMAASFDPRNEEYRAAADDALRSARKIQAKNFVALAESAESFANLREALANYQKAVDYETDDARPYYRLGVLLRRVEEDHRAALDLFRTAVTKAPNNVEFRLALGELYSDLGLKVNAEGQFRRVLTLDKGNAKAKAGLKGL